MILSSDFPEMDAPRSTEDGRIVLDEFNPLEPYILETDFWVAMPVRLAHSSIAGLYIEIGPYDLDISDIRVLRKAIAAYDKAVGPRIKPETTR